MSKYRLRVLTENQVETFHREGYLIIPDVFSSDEMDQALAEAEKITYGMSFERWKTRITTDGTGREVADGIGRHDNPGRSQFPTGVRVLDRLVEKEVFLDIIADIAGTEDLHYLNGHLFLRAGPTDKRYPAHPWEGFHFDHDGVSFLPPWNRPGSFDSLGCGILLNDVDQDCAPVVQVPGSHRLLPEILPRLIAEGLFIPPSSFTDIRKIPEFAPRTTWTGKKGTIGVSSSYMVHAAVPFRDISRQRAWWTMSIGRAATMPFVRNATPYSGADRSHIVKFWNATTARVRSLFGWPPPGHPYYTPESLALLAAQYPDMDLSAYSYRQTARKPTIRIPEGYVATPAGGMQRAGNN